MCYVKRNSSIESLKIIAIVLIVLSHSIPNGDTTIHPGAIDINMVTSNINIIIASYIKNLGQIGNDIFLICSTWFLVDSKCVKVNKIADMVGDCFFISVFMLGLFMALGYKFSTVYILKQFFPITFENCWFLTCYLLLYAIHPFLNHIIKLAHKKSLLCFNLCFFVLYNCVGFIMGNQLFYFSRLIGFIGLYMLIAYIKLYLPNALSSKKLNLILLAGGVCGWIIQLQTTAILGKNISFFSTKMQHWNSFMNPVFICIAISLFNIFRQKEFYSRRINNFSSLSLLIYLIHETRIMSDYIKYEIFEMIQQLYGFDYLLLWIFVYAFILLIVSSVLAIIYKNTIQKIIHWLFEKLCRMIVKIYGFISEKILQLN
ncbi:MAG: acyltransferase [Bacteroides sp.]|nr:acyltransferase [Bacteroides sp.]MCM1550906.1 acyltransferase [Clostridium sp.]